MDVNNALEPAVAHRPLPTGDDSALPREARWRQRGVVVVVAHADADVREHVDLPLDEAGAGMADTGFESLSDRTPESPPEPQPPAEPEHALRDAELWVLARRTQGAVLRLDFELRTPLIRQVFRRDFVYVSRQLHGLEMSRRVQGLDRACLNDALAALQRRADDVQALLERIAADLQSAIDTRGPANARIAFARPTRFQATIVSPAARRYLTLLTQADDTLARLEMAWLLGLVEPASRTALSSDCRRALHGFKDLAADRRQAMGALVREVNAERKEGSMERPEE